jgi:hypothetical protein
MKATKPTKPTGKPAFVPSAAQHQTRVAKELGSNMAKAAKEFKKGKGK